MSSSLDLDNSDLSVVDHQEASRPDFMLVEEPVIMLHNPLAAYTEDAVPFTKPTPHVSVEDSKITSESATVLPSRSHVLVWKPTISTVPTPAACPSPVLVWKPTSPSVSTPAAISPPCSKDNHVKPIPQNLSPVDSLTTYAPSTWCVSRTSHFRQKDMKDVSNNIRMQQGNSPKHTSTHKMHKGSTSSTIARTKTGTGGQFLESDSHPGKDCKEVLSAAVAVSPNEEQPKVLLCIENRKGDFDLAMVPVEGTKSNPQVQDPKDGVPWLEKALSEFHGEKSTCKADYSIALTNSNNCNMSEKRRRRRRSSASVSRNPASASNVGILPLQDVQGEDLRNNLNEDALKVIAKTDPQRAKRILCSRAYAAQRLAADRKQMSELQHANGSLLQQISLLQEHHVSVHMENCELKQQLETMEQKEKLRDELNDRLKYELAFLTHLLATSLPHMVWPGSGAASILSSYNIGAGDHCNNISSIQNSVTNFSAH